MALQLWELMESRAQSLGQKSKVVLNYAITGSNGDDVAAHAFLRANTPLYYGGLGRQDTSLGDWNGRDFFGTAEYAGATAFDAGESEFTFDTTGGSWKITQSLETKESAPSGAPDFQRAINVGPDGAAGVNLPLPGSLAFEETHVFSDAAVTPAYKLTLALLSRTVNAGSFKGFSAGEVYAKGVRGSKRNGEEWRLTFYFLAEPNKTGVEVAPGISVSAADGFDYVWAAYRREDDAGQLVTRAFAAYVGKVFERTDFSGFGIGT